ncbi:MAG: condensation domain-containing protein, partial [Planctomycetota bacterium]
MEQFDLRSRNDEITRASNSADADGQVAAEIRQAAVEHASRPFDLSRDQLLRASTYRVGDERWIVLFTMHHVIADAWSTEILLRDLGAHYRAHLIGSRAQLDPLPIQYADYAVWQRNWLQGEVLERQLGYWMRQLDGELPTLQLPTDFPRKRVQTFSGGVEEFAVTPDVADKLRSLSQENSASLFMTLLAAYCLLLRRYTGQSDLLVGTPVANRHRRQVEDLIGIFVNTLVIRTRIDPQACFVDLLRSVRETTLEAYEHQDVPFEKLVETLQPERDMSLSPLFQAKFRLENAPQREVDLPGLKLRRLPQQIVSAKLDLSLDMYETADGLVGAFEYNADLFAAETISRMAGHFTTLLGAIANSPDVPVADLAVLTPAEEKRQRYEWNDRDVPYQDDACFHELFEAQVERTPEQAAVVFDGPTRETATYRDLNERANRWAHCLREFGVG